MYVDGFVVPIKKDRVEDYREMATEAGEVWMESGALSYVETVADDVPDGEVTSFALALKLEDDEVPGLRLGHLQLARAPRRGHGEGLGRRVDAAARPRTRRWT